MFKTTIIAAVAALTLGVSLSAAPAEAHGSRYGYGGYSSGYNTYGYDSGYRTYTYVPQYKSYGHTGYGYNSGYGHNRGYSCGSYGC